MNSRELFLNSELRTGGFYELALQVCPSLNNEPIQLYTDFIWQLDNVEGPFDSNFELITTDLANIEHRGIVNLDGNVIPFMTYNVREEEPLETGFNWFDICFYTAAIEQIFGDEYQTWTEQPKVPNELSKFMNLCASELYKIYPFELALIDFETSGQYYIDDLNKDLEAPFRLKFYIGTANRNKISESNMKFVTFIEEL